MKDVEAERLERVLGHVLRIGAAGSTAILAVGLVLALVRPSLALAQTIMRVGLFVLLLTPVARVVASVIEYARDSDWLFASLTFVVLVIVVASLLYGAV